MNERYREEKKSIHENPELCQLKLNVQFIDIRKRQQPDPMSKTTNKKLSITFNFGYRTIPSQTATKN